jgi:hypothetical protein
MTRIYYNPQSHFNNCNTISTSTRSDCTRTSTRPSLTKTIASIALGVFSGLLFGRGVGIVVGAFVYLYSLRSSSSTTRTVSYTNPHNQNHYNNNNNGSEFNSFDSSSLERQTGNIWEERRRENRIQAGTRQQVSSIYPSAPSSNNYEAY